MTMMDADAGGGVEGAAVRVGVWADGITIGCGRPGVVLREMGMIVLGPAVDWFPLVSLLFASVLSLCSLAWLTLLTTSALSASTTSLAMIKASLLMRSVSSALEPDSDELASSIGERGAGTLFSRVVGSTGAS